MGKAIRINDADFSAFGLGKVTPKAAGEGVTNIPLRELVINGSSGVNGASAQYSVQYVPENTTEKGVTWSIESGSQWASINPTSGLLTVIEGATGASVTIKVVSKQHNAIEATKTVVVTNKVEEVPEVPIAKINVFELYGHDPESNTIIKHPDTAIGVSTKSLTDGFVAMLAYEEGTGNGTAPMFYNDNTNTGKEPFFGVSGNGEGKVRIWINAWGNGPWNNGTQLNSRYCAIRMAKGANYFEYFSGTAWIKLAESFDKNSDVSVLKVFPGSYTGKYHVKFYYTSDIPDSKVVDFFENVVNGVNYEVSWLDDDEQAAVQL